MSTPTHVLTEQMLKATIAQDQDFKYKIVIKFIRNCHYEPTNGLGGEVIQPIRSTTYKLIYILVTFAQKLVLKAGLLRFSIL